MATSGAAAWEKHFKPKFMETNVIETIIAKETSVYNSSGQTMSRVNAGDKVFVLKTDVYEARTPVTFPNDTGTVFYVTFDNIRKPQGKSVSGIKIKPQDFPSVSGKLTFSSDELAKGLLDDLDGVRSSDLDTTLNWYLSELVMYWSGNKTDITNLRKAYSKLTVGKAETAKDFGEMLGALACIKKNILPIKVPSGTVIEFPWRGNEPLVDYYLVNSSFNGGKLSISAKSGSTTNTLKPQDILKLLNTSGKASSWSSKPIYKLMQLVVDTSTVLFPFVAVNFVSGKEIINNATLEEAKKFKVSDFSSKTYKYHMFNGLLKLLGIPLTNPPSMGELFYKTEKYVIEKANSTENLKPTSIFEAATAGAVTYVKYEITDSSPEGKFSILVTDGAKIDKKDIKWRSKNATTRAADKIGLQP
jgi:hypothetical protein